MVFFYYEFETGRHIAATNIKAVSEFSGISYGRVYRWFRDGRDVYKGEGFIMLRTKVRKGMQRVKAKKKVAGKINDYDMKVKSTLF